MAVSYEVPPWLHPSAAQGFGQLYAEGLKMRNAAQMQAADLAERSAEANMRLQAQQQAAEQDRLREDQALQIRKAYEDAQIGLRKSELEQSQQVIDQKTQLAARAFAANQKYSQLRAQGVPEDQALMQVGPEAIQLASEVHKMMPPRMPTLETASVDGQNIPYLLDRETGAPHILRASVPGGMSRQTIEQLRDLRKQRDEIAKEYSDPMMNRVLEKTPKGKEDLDAAMSKVKSLESQIAKITGASTSTGTDASEKRGAPQVGDIVKGYRYKGGDPSKKESWEKVQ